MNRLRGWWRVALGVLALLAVPALVEAHTFTGTGGWLDELVCLVPALVMVAVVLLIGRDSPSGRKGKADRAKSSGSGHGRPGDQI